MRKKIVIMFSLLLVTFVLITTCFASNPIITNIYTADPAPLIYNGRVYAYVGHDENSASGSYLMKDWRCYSSTDMVNWTDHGAVLDVTKFSWAGQTKDANAAQVIYRNGKFYYYVSVMGSGGIAIGVGVSTSPTGPFTDALGKALVTHSMTNFSGYATHTWRNLDPTVFIDDDGQAYLYWGNNACYWVKLNSDMISLNGSINYIPLTTAAFGQDFEEAPWVYKRNGLYYMMFAAGFPEWIAYSTSSSPTGPWTYRGAIMPKQGGSDTIHPGVIDFNGGSYFFYHKAALQGGDSFHRAVCVEKFTYNTDGTFPTINMTTTGGIGGTPTQRQNTPTPTIRPGTPTPTRRGGSGTIVECENMTLGGSYAGKISSPFSGVALYANNDYCAYTQYFGLSTHSFSARGCSNNSSTARVDLKIGGTTVGSFYFAGTTPTVQTLSNITHGTGNQEVRLTVTTDTGSWDAYVDYLQIN